MITELIQQFQNPTNYPLYFQPNSNEMTFLYLDKEANIFKVRNEIPIIPHAIIAQQNEIVNINSQNSTVQLVFILTQTRNAKGTWVDNQILQMKKTLIKWIENYGMENITGAISLTTSTDIYGNNSISVKASFNYLILDNLFCCDEF